MGCPALTCKPSSASICITSPRSYFPILQAVILVPISKIGASHPTYDGRIPQSYKLNGIDSGNSDVLEPWLHLVYQPSLSLFYLCRIYLSIHLFKISCALLWRRQWHPTPVLLPGKSHGRRSLVGCSPWGPWGSDMTERLHFHFSLWCIGEGSGNPLQCSCLENPRDGGAWWLPSMGSHSQTRLKWLSIA